MPAGTVVVEEGSSWLTNSRFAATFVCRDDRTNDVTQERRLGCLRTEGGLLYYMEQGAGDIISHERGSDMGMDGIT
jgi:hypothetical protein